MPLAVIFHLSEIYLFVSKGPNSENFFPTLFTLIMNNTTGLSINDNIFGKMSTWTFSYFDDPPRVGSMASSCFSKWGVGLNFIQCWLASLVW